MIYGNGGEGRIATVKPEGIGRTIGWGDTNVVEVFTRVLGKKEYELKDHLGNVRVVISDVKLNGDGDQGGQGGRAGQAPYMVDMRAYNNYYPFGMLQPERSWSTEKYRYGFNGKEMDNEMRENPTTGTSGTGNHYDYGFRGYDPRSTRFLSVDPLAPEYPWNSTYAFAENDVIRSIDLEGAERYIVIYNDKKKAIKTIDFYDIEEGAHGSLGYGTLHFYADGSNKYGEDGKTYRYTGKLTGNEFIEKTKEEINSSKSFLYGILKKKIEAKIKNFQPAEKYVLRRNPYSAYQSQDAQTISENITYKSSTNTTVNDIVGGAHNGKADAIRHALWSTLMADMAGLDFSEQMGTAHEQDRTTTQPLGEKLMDLNNNSVGRSVYSSNPSASMQEMYNVIIDQAAAGNLMMYDDSTGKASSFTLTKDELIKLKSLDISKYTDSGSGSGY